MKQRWVPLVRETDVLPAAGGDARYHLAREDMPGTSMAEAEQRAAGIAGPAYAMDDQTAIKAADGIVEVVCEGQWKLFPR